MDTYNWSSNAADFLSDYQPHFAHTGVYPCTEPVYITNSVDGGAYALKPLEHFNNTHHYKEVVEFFNRLDQEVGLLLTEFPIELVVCPRKLYDNHIHTEIAVKESEHFGGYCYVFRVFVDALIFTGCDYESNKRRLLDSLSVAMDDFEQMINNIW